MLRQRFLSLAMVLGVGFLLLVSLALSAALAVLTGAIDQHLPGGQLIAKAFDFIVSFGVITVLFALMFKYLPDVKIPWRKVWIGAIGTALLFTIGKFVIGLYLGRQGTTSSYGAAGSVIVVLMWIYYSSVILLFGAEFTQVYAKQTGARIVPSKYAEPVTQEERAEQGIPHEGEGTGQRQPTPPQSPPSRPRPRGEPRRPSLAPEYEPGTGYRIAPGEAVHRNAWQFVGMMLAAGVVGGVLLRLKWLRKGLKLYTTVRKLGVVPKGHYASQARL